MNGSRNRFGWAAAVLGLALAWAAAWSGAAQAAEGGASVGAGAGAECDPEEFICIDVFEDDPDAVTARWLGAEKTWVIDPPTGSVRIRHKGDTVTARRMRLREEDEYARLEEDVVVVRDDVRAEADALDLWWDREEYLFTGDVVFTQIEDAEGDEGAKPVERTIWAREMRYHGKTKDAEARGDVRMVDDQYRVWAQHMTYRQEPEEMTFTEAVKVQTSDEEWTITGERFEYDVEAEEGHIVGPHRIEVMPRD